MTLRENSMSKALDTLLAQVDDDDSSLLSEAELLADFVPQLRRRLFEGAAHLSPSPQILRLLRKVFIGQSTIDLAPFSKLTVQDLSAVIEGQNDMKVLNISHRLDLQDSDLQRIFKCYTTPD